jgi:hypothetical protein
MRSQTIKFILHDGTPYGLKTVEVVGWSGKVTVVPRAALKQFQKLPEAATTGVYFLRGAGEDGERCYVGQSDVVFDRLTNHARTK